MNNDIGLNEHKLNNLLDDMNNDRQKLFNDIKNKDDEKIKQRKLIIIDSIISKLISFKKVLYDEKKLLNKEN